MDENDRQAMIIAQFRNKDSAMYKNMVAILRDCEQADKRARAKSAYVGFPFSMDATDTAALEAQFNVRIKLTAGQKRSPLTDRVAGMIVLLDAALLEHAGGVGRDVMIIDGDIMTSVACGIDGVVIERSNATPRLAYGYHMEDEMVHRAVTCKTDKLAVKAEILHREIVAGGGEHYSPVVQLEGGNVAAIVVNHFKTPVGPHQLAYLAIHRAASVFGCLPFQPDMLIKDVGDLICFPGKYYIDHGLDTLTMVPSQDATMSISMPYSSWRAIITNNVITVDNVEFLCEKYNSVPGVLYYTLQSVTDDFEFPEKLTTNYFDCKKLGITEISMPKVKFSDSGVPVGWDRKVVRVFTERVEKVLARLMTSANQIVMPSEAFSVLCDYNNTVINSLDTTQIAKRMDVDDEMEVANALALHTNWMRHASKGTFKVLLDAVKLKYDVAEVNVLRLAAVALHAWWSSPNFERDVKYEEVPVSQVLDWCGNDFSVLMKEADPWIEISQMSGVKLASGAKYYDWMPKPTVTKESSWFKNIMDRVYASAASSISPVAAKQKPKSAIIPAVTRKLMKPAASGAFVGAEVSEGEVLVSRSQPNFTPVKSLLLDKLIVEQGAFKSNSVVRGLTVIEGPSNTLMPTIPIEDVEPYSAIMDDLLMVNKGPIESLGVKTAYRLAEADISKNVSGSFMINDFKRNLPKSKFVRMPKIDAGVEGSRAASQISLFGALAKRNLGVPNNRGSVNLDAIAPLAVDRMIATCYREDWETIVEKHLDAGMFEFNVPDIENFIDGIDEKKVKAILNEFFMEGHVQLDKWQLFAKPGVKPGREPQSHSKVDHAQTILFLRESSVNAAYSAMIKHLKECIDECLRPNVHIIPQCSDAEQEEWYNSLQPLRDGCRRTYSYGNDIRTFDRSLEKPASRLHMEFYARHGLNSDRLKIWESQYGLKKASSMMFGIVVYLGTIGISGIFDTIMRNSICTWGATVVGGKLERQDIIMLDIKGDDMDLETSRPVNVEETIEIMSLSFNFSAKMYTNDVRYYCKQFRVRKWGRWYQIADPWAKIQSLCKPLVVGHMEDLLDERYVSLQSDLRHYDNGLLVDVAAECAQVYYGTERPLYGFAKALAVIASDRSKYFAMFHPAERID